MAFVVRGKSGKVVGTYATRGEAERRIAQLKAGAERLRRFQFAGGRRAASPVNPLGEYAAHQRRMKTFVAQKYNGTREYVHNSAIPSGAGHWTFWTKPAGGGKSRQEYATHAEIAGSRYESSPEHSWPGQPRRHARAARLGLRRHARRYSHSPAEFPRVSMTWGVMPPFAEFARRVDAGGGGYPIEAHSTSAHGKLLRRLRVQPSGVGEYGRNRYVLSPKQLYGLVNRLSNMDPDAGEGLASSIMETLGYEWI